MATAELNQLLLLVGLNEDGDLIFHLYDVENDDWHSEIFFPDKEMRKRINRTFCVIEQKVFFLAKIENEETSGAPDAKIFGMSYFEADKHKSYEICTFDLVTKEITETGAKFKTASHGLTKFEPIEDKIYFIASTENALWCYDVKENNLAVCSPIGLMFMESNMTSANGSIYIIGENHMGIHCMGEKYNPATQELTSMAKVPFIPRKVKFGGREMGCTELNGKIYAVNNDSFANIFVYTPETDEWQTISVKKNPFNLNGGGYLTNCNGQLIGLDPRCYVHIYNFEKKKWKSVKDYNGSLILTLSAFPVYKTYFTK